MEQGKTLLRLHEARSDQSSVDSQAEGGRDEERRDSELDGGLGEEGPGALRVLRTTGAIPELKRPGRRRVEATEEESRVVAEATEGTGRERSSSSGSSRLTMRGTYLTTASTG